MSGTQQEEAKDKPGVPLWALMLASEVRGGKMKARGEFSLGTDYQAELREGKDSLWLLVRGKAGGFALRVAYLPGDGYSVEEIAGREGEWEYRATTPAGAFRILIKRPEANRPLLRCTTSVIPSTDLLLPYWPRDLYPFDNHGDPTHVGGVVEAAQRGLNAGLLYARLQEPDGGSILYFQNLTALNDYFVATETRPDGVVGGDWPEMGYKMPVSQDKPLKAGKEVVLSDAFVHFAPEQSEDQRTTAGLFLDLLAGIYKHLDRPTSAFHPWPTRAQETLRDLEHSPKATIKEHGYTYLHPYTDSEYPDSMVQLTVLMALREYERWRETRLPFADELRKGIRNFYDIGLGTVRRYLISVGDDKDADEVDSWYLYHPLVNLGRLAEEENDQEARELFLGSMAYAIKVAHRFNYEWPVQFNVETLDIIKKNRKEGDPGQSDVGGIYAHVMLQAYNLTHEELYLEEARKAIRATGKMQFELVYQTNITAYGIVACLRLWKLTGDAFYKEQSYVFLAGYFHNCVLWDSQIGNAKHYMHFLAATCLHDGPYMSPYECSESYASFQKYLEIGGDEIPESVRLLMTEFCKYAVDRLWRFFPDNLPTEAIATEVRNGHIDRLLAFPLEDLYADGQPAGQVGQEIYGSGAAFVVTTRAFHRLKSAPFILYCAYPISDLKESEETGISFYVQGAEGFRCPARLIPLSEQRLPSVRLQATGGEELACHGTPEEHCEFMVPPGRINISWKGK